MSSDNETWSRRDDGTRTVRRAARGEHLCSFHGTPEQQRGLAAGFVAAGLGAGERVLYLANEHPAEEVLQLLTADSIDAGASADGQLMVLDFDAVAGPPSARSVERVAARYRGEAERSRTDGYPGLRIAVEMGDLEAELGGLDALAAWEQTVDQVFREGGVTALCQYDAGRHGTVERERIAAEHAAVATDDGSAPTATLRATRTPWGLAAAGELDLSTASAFSSALRARASVQPRVTVDLAAVTFADVATLRTVFTVARELPAGGALSLIRVPSHIVRTLVLLGWHDPRVHVDSA